MQRFIVPKKRSNSDDVEARAERLRESSDGPASLVHHIYFTFLLFGTYIGITKSTISDKQLFKVSSATLSILNVQPPIVAFYAFIPWLFLLFHFNLILFLLIGIFSRLFWQRHGCSPSILTVQA